MTKRVIDSLETVELVMLMEEIFEVEMPDAGTQNFGSPREIVDCSKFSYQTRGRTAELGHF